MDFRKKFSSPKKLFFIFVLALWFFTIAFTLYIDNQTKYHKAKLFDTELQFANNYIISTFAHADKGNDSIHIPENIYFKKQFYKKLVITVYNKDGKIIHTNNSSHSIDFKSKLPPEVEEAFLHGSGYTRNRKNEDGEPSGFYSATYDKASGILVHTHLPFTGDILKIIEKERYEFISILILITVLLSVIAYAMATFMERNLKNLNEFAKGMAQNITNPKIEKTFTIGEADEISEQIISLYNDKMGLLGEKEKLMEEEQEKLRSKRILANNISHEIKTPIGILQGYLETIITHPEMEQELRTKFLKRCLQNVQRLNNMMTSLSMITRLEDGTNAIVLEKVDLYDAVTAIEEDTHSLLKEKNMTFISNIKPKTFIKSNTATIYTILHNLIKNAAKYSEGTNINFRIESEDEEFYTFEFADDGKGIDKKHIPNLFERFYRIEKNKDTEGSGLGLAIVKSAIAFHNGTITAHTHKGKGLSFIFTLPKV